MPTKVKRQPAKVKGRAKAARRAGAKGQAAPDVIELPIEQIVALDAIQSRAAVDEFAVDEFAEDMRKGDDFPPLEVLYDGTTHWLWDGFHRLPAAVAAELKSFRCHVRKGTKEDAMWLALTANHRHGLRRSNEDKRRAVQRALEMHPELSDSAIAEHCGVSHVMVADYRPRPLEESSSGPAPTSRRTGRDGRVINTARIGKGQAGKRGKANKAAPAPREAPAVIPIRPGVDRPDTAGADPAPAAPSPARGPADVVAAVLQLIGDSANLGDDGWQEVARLLASTPEGRQAFEGLALQLWEMHDALEGLAKHLDGLAEHVAVEGKRRRTGGQAKG
jgi:hypothetical protein